MSEPETWAQDSVFTAVHGHDVTLIDHHIDPVSRPRLCGPGRWLSPVVSPIATRPVEDVRGAETSDRTMDCLCEFVRAVDRRPIAVQKEVPGFVWNRIQTVVISECLHLLKEDIASMEDINAAVRDGYARRTSVIGPFETVDIVGAEQFQTIAENLYPYLSATGTVQETFDELLTEGRSGIDTGAGFHQYSDQPETILHRRDAHISALTQQFESFDQ